MLRLNRNDSRSIKPLLIYSNLLCRAKITWMLILFFVWLGIKWSHHETKQLLCRAITSICFCSNLQPSDASIATSLRTSTWTCLHNRPKCIIYADTQNNETYHQNSLAFVIQKGIVFLRRIYLGGHSFEEG